MCAVFQPNKLMRTKGKETNHKAGKCRSFFVSQVWLFWWTKLQCSIDLTAPSLQLCLSQNGSNDFCTAQ